MVETEGTELPTSQPVIEPVSDARVRNENFRCGDRTAKRPQSRRKIPIRPRFNRLGVGPDNKASTAKPALLELEPDRRTQAMSRGIVELIGFDTSAR